MWKTLSSILTEPRLSLVRITNVSKIIESCVFAVGERKYAPLQLVQIFFGTATYDKIEKDQKVTFEAQLGLIGGTMGLLTGFSILSAIEIVYFVLKLVIRSRA